MENMEPDEPRTFSKVKAFDRRIHGTASYVYGQCSVIVDNVEAAVGFYTTHSGSGFSRVRFQHLRMSHEAICGAAERSDEFRGLPCRTGAGRSLALESYSSHRGRPAGESKDCKKAGLSFGARVVTGPGGRQVVLDDPAGQPRRTLSAAQTSDCRTEHSATADPDPIGIDDKAPGREESRGSRDVGQTDAASDGRCGRVQSTRFGHRLAAP